MTVMLRIPAVVVLAIMAQATSAAGQAGPFGIRMGMTAQELTQLGAKVSTNGNGAYTLESVPQPHPDFEFFLVNASPAQGACRILAMSKTVQSSSHGIEVKQEFMRLVAAIESRYGKAQVEDKLLPNSIWDEPNDWMMGLRQKERVLRAVWAKEGGLVGPDNGVAVIALEPFGADTDSSAFALTYELANFGACRDELLKQQNSSF